MACFLVPVGEAIVTTFAQMVIEKWEQGSNGSHEGVMISEKLGMLNKMLWGGSGLLAFEHVWHGELSPFFPFLTAAQSPDSTMEMLREMATSGTSMALLVTAVWGIAIALEFRKSSHRRDEVDAL